MTLLLVLASNPVPSWIDCDHAFVQCPCWYFTSWIFCVLTVRRWLCFSLFLSVHRVGTEAVLCILLRLWYSLGLASLCLWICWYNFFVNQPLSFQLMRGMCVCTSSLNFGAPSLLFWTFAAHPYDTRGDGNVGHDCWCTCQAGNSLGVDAVGSCFHAAFHQCSAFVLELFVVEQFSWY